MTRSLALVLAVLVLPHPLPAQTVCPCVPITHLWVVKSCDTFDCATSEFVLSSGSTDTMVVPTSSADVKWVVLTRVTSGTAVSFDPTFKLESFDGFTDASTRFGTIDAGLKPMIVSSPDGKFLIIARHAPEPRRRAVAR